MTSRLLYRSLIALLMISTLTCNLVMITFLQRFFYGDLKVEDPATLYRISSSIGSRGDLSYPDFRRFSETCDAFDSLSATFLERGIAVYLEENALWSDIAWASGSFYDVVKNGNLVGGRFFDDTDDKPGAAKVAVLNQNSWEKLRPGKPFQAGAQVFVKGQAFEVVGIVTNDFPFLDSMADINVWAPIQQNPLSWQYEIDGALNYQLLARLDPSKTNVANLQIAAALEDVKERLGFTYSAKVLSETDFRIQRRPGMYRLFLVLFLVTGFLFLLGTVNQLLMLVTRSVAISADLKVMAALGARPKHILFRFLRGFSNLVVVSIVGVALCSVTIVQLYNYFWGVNYGVIPLSRLVEPLPLAILTTMLVMLVTLHVSFPLITFFSAGDSLLTRGRAAGSRYSAKNRLSITGVIFQVALVTVCILGCGAFLNSLQSEGSVKASHNEQRLLCINMALASQETEYSNVVSNRLNRIGNALLELGGVEAYSTSNALPLHNSGGGQIMVEGEPKKEEPEWISAAFVSPGYFETMGIDIYKGRDFLREDATKWPHEKYIINQAYADKEFPDTEPLGRRIAPWEGTGFGEIVAVVQNVPDTVSGNIRPKIYIPFYQNRFVLNLFLSHPVLPEIHGRLISEKIQEIDPEAVIVSIETIDTIWDEILAAPRLGFIILLTLSLVGLFLSLSGIYGYQSYIIALRQREFAIRHAIGQPTTELFWSEVFRGLKITLIGFACGVAIFYLGLYAFKADLYNIHLPALSAIIISIALVSAFTTILTLASSSTKTPKLEILMRE
ncbi:efflux ABC transporter, permease protein [Verrucomicrobiia bacterium DG1235]|nr:efflux ABC transporter, permease protein [Verrucomicrobiae bacterium DG1235]